MDKNARILAIDAGGTFFKSGLVDTEGRIMEGSRFSCPVDCDGDARTVREAYQTIASYQMNLAKKTDSVITAVGVDTPGPFDYEQGMSCMQHKFRALYKIPLRPWIWEVTGDVPIYFLHDSTAFLLGEWWKGSLSNSQDGAGVMLGTGLGFSYMKGGSVQLNPQGGPAYPLYTEPYRDGIAEDYVSRRGIIRRYQERISGAGGESEKSQKTIDVADIAALAKEGDKKAEETMEETGRMLGEILVPVLRKTGCKSLVVGGQISKAYSCFGGALEETLKELKLEKTGPSRNPDDSHLSGCAFAVLSRQEKRASYERYGN